MAAVVGDTHLHLDLDISQLRPLPVTLLQAVDTSRNRHLSSRMEEARTTLQSTQLQLLTL